MRELLALIAGQQTDGYLEIRALGERNIQTFIDVTNLDHAEAVITQRAQTHDVFVGAAPRATKHGGRAAVPHTWALWIDCDDEAATERLHNFTPEPSLTVASGTPGRVHAWWGMANPVPADHAERAMRRLAHHLGADPRCAEVARIMRIPETSNHKHDPPTPVRTVQLGEAFIPLSMVADLPDPPSKRAAILPPRTKADDPLLGISAQEYVPRLTGRTIDIRGYAQCPLHDDYRPSLMCYADPARGWYCFQHGAGGTVYDFASALWGMPTSGIGFVQLKERLTAELL